jgi:acyl carrier protein
VGDAHPEKEVAMGLDTVELAMTIEETFGITISDEDGEKILTIGDAYRYILAKMDGPPLTTPGCPSAAAFYRVRRQLMGRFRVERRRIRPASRLDDLISETNRRAEWRRLGKCLGWKLPDLVRPGWVGSAFLGLLLAWAMMLIVAWGRLAGFASDAVGLLVFGLLIGAVLLAVAVYQLTRPFATVFPTPDIRGLIPMVLGANFGTFRINNPHGWTSRDVRDALISIIAEQVGVTREQLTESTSFVNDLGRN